MSVTFSGIEPGYVELAFADPEANRCAVDPVGDISTAIDHDPGYILAYRSGKDASCLGSVFAPWWLGAPSLYHRQGIQRIHRDSKNYLLVTHSVPAVEDTIWDPGFEVVELGAHGTIRRNLGSGGATPTTQAPCANHIVKYWEYSSPVRRHGGGLQVNGDYAVVAFDSHDHDIQASFRTVNVGDPPNAFSGPTKFRQRGNMNYGSSASLTKTNDGKFLVLVFGDYAGDVEVFVSTGTSMPTSPDQWLSKTHRVNPLNSSNQYNNAQFITQCDNDPTGDGSQDRSGPLFLLATHNTSGEDWADLFKVTFDATTYAPSFLKVAGREMTCSSPSTGGVRYCDFAAGGGSFVDVDGDVILYGVEHYNDHFNPNTDFGVKVREFPNP